MHEEFVAALTASVTENVIVLREVLIGVRDSADVQLAQPRSLAVLQARLGIPQAALQLSYRVGFLAMWRFWAEVIEHHAGPDADRTVAVRALTELIFGYQNSALIQVAADHVRTEQAMQASREHIRHRIVGEVISGALQPVAADIATLGYDLTGEHLAV